MSLFGSSSRRPGTPSRTAAARSFHERLPARYREECQQVLNECSAMRPVLTQVPDGRRGFMVEIALPDPAGSILMRDGSHRYLYKLLLLWNHDHPRSASNLYGGSIKAYFASPTDTVICRRMRDLRGAPVPHLIADIHPLTGAECLYPCTAQLGVLDESFTMRDAIANAVNWLTKYGAALYSDAAYESMAMAQD